MTTTQNTEAHTVAIICQSCDWQGHSVNEAIGHELNRHDGAQTCWWEREMADA